eukprot:PITA_28236
MANVNFIPAARDGTSSASTSQGNTNSYVYQVFLNHRGPDVKEGLATHIYNGLKKLGLSVFLDQPELQRGEELKPQIEGAIRTASVHVAIFSPSYAQSSWCLDELVLMREQKLKSGSTIIPVFYKVQPADLRWARVGKGVYARDLGEHERKSRYDTETIEKWRNALSAVADIVGFELKDKEESQLVQEVVQQVVKKVRKPPLDVAKYPTGLHEKIKDVDRTLSLQRQSEKATVLGIVGFGGVGKTTLAKQFFNRERSNYDRSCFLFDIRSKSLPSVQSSLLKDLIQSDAQINSVAEGIERLKTVSQRCLIILDDIDHIDQMDALCAPVINTIDVGSLILITSRNKDVLLSAGIGGPSIYTLNVLNVEHSQNLFCWHAFGQPSPVVGFEKVVEEFLNVCNGLPLSLKVLGALLRGKDDLKLWNAQLRKTSKVLPEDIRSTLRISYDALDKEEKEIFLDIACFFIGEDRDTAIRVWDGSNWEGLLGLWKLENRCLVEVDGKNCLRMHDHLRDLGRYIAEDLEYPRRLWHSTENFLDNMSRQSFVRGISRSNRSMLQLLGTESDSVERIFSSEQLPPLVYLHWKHCPKSSLAPSIPLKYLRWKHCLKSSLALSVPLNNLSVLHIEGVQLETLWQHEFQAPLQLRELHIDAPLSKLPKSIGKLKHLEKVFLKTRCLKTISNEFFNLSGLQSLQLECEQLQTLPKSIGNLSGLRRLDLTGCSTLKMLPDSVVNLSGLQSVNLSWCSSLQTLPDSVGNLSDLQSLDLTYCSSLQTLPDSVGNLSALQSLDLRVCKSLQTLPDSLGNLSALQSLHLSECSKLQTLPDSLGNLSALQSLHLNECSKLQTLPDSVGNLSGLQSLDLMGCGSLQTLPDSVGNLSGLQSLVLPWCMSLQTLPHSVGNLSGLQSLVLPYCVSLQTLPDSVGNLSGLQSLDLNCCCSLQTLPDSVGNLSGLQSLDMIGCHNVKMLPESVGNLSGLRSLYLSCCSRLQTLPDSVGNLSGLRSLNLSQSNSLQTLPDSVGNLSDLRSLDLSECQGLKMLPDSVGNLSGLQILDLSGCSSLQTLPDSVRNLSCFRRR